MSSAHPAGTTSPELDPLASPVAPVVDPVVLAASVVPDPVVFAASVVPGVPVALVPSSPLVLAAPVSADEPGRPVVTTGPVELMGAAEVPVVDSPPSPAGGSGPHAITTPARSQKDVRIVE